MSRRTRRIGTILVGLAVVGTLVWRELWTREEDAIGPATVVMLGDSITAGGDWANLLPGHEVVNRGRVAFTTAELLPTAEAIARAHPRAVFVLTGTNDIRDGHPAEWTSREMDRILDRFESISPDTVVVVQTVLPRADATTEVAAANDAIRDLVARRDLRLLDLHPWFDDGVGGLRPEDTTDGIHLAPPGYQRWAGRLLEMLAEIAEV